MPGAGCGRSAVHRWINGRAQIGSTRLAEYPWPRQVMRRPLAARWSGVRRIAPQPASCAEPSPARERAPASSVSGALFSRLDCPSDRLPFVPTRGPAWRPASALKPTSSLPMIRGPTPLGPCRPLTCALPGLVLRYPTRSSPLWTSHISAMWIGQQITSGRRGEPWRRDTK